MNGPGETAGAAHSARMADDLPAPDLRIEGGTILTLDAASEPIETGFVDILGGRITAAGPVSDRPATSARRVIDASGSVVLPGLVDAHTHLFQVAARGLGDGLGLAEWLRTHMIPLALALRRTEMVALTELAALHALRSGTVAAVNHHYGGFREPEDAVAVAGAMERVGLAGAVARMMVGERTAAADAFGLPAANFGYTNAQEIEFTAEAMRAKADGPVAVWPGPANVAYCSEEILLAGADLARQYGVRWHTHAAEDAFAVEVTRRHQDGRRTLAVLEDLGVLDSDATLAHAVWLDDAEIELAATRLPHLVHNPLSNAYLGSGTMRLTELRSRGVRLAAGSDGCAVAGQDMFTVARFGALLQRVAATDASVISVGDMIQLIAGGGARALGTGTGTIAPGERADLIVVNTSSLHHEPVNDPLATAGWFATGLDVSTVVVGGTPVLDEGSITTVDEAEVRARGLAAARAVMARL
ncbi:MAG: amidohydrolase family protein [Acidimicrobiia bacterium]|nr:amidohydrolase family protein [Acidimicrobiia bacterium]